MRRDEQDLMMNVFTRANVNPHPGSFHLPYTTQSSYPYPDPYDPDAT